MRLRHILQVSTYQRSWINSVEAANGILQFLARDTTQKVADGPSTAHNNANIHPRLQTIIRRDTNEEKYWTTMY